LHEIEPLLVEWCIAMAQCGQALNRFDVIDLASDLIKGTSSEKKMIEYKRKRGFEVNEGETVLGVTWYQSFMKRHGDELKRGKCIPKDINRHTWCTLETFTDMYAKVYEAFVKAGIAEKLEEDIMYDKEGNITTDVSQIYGRPTKYKMNHPEYILFVDETGCNTNQKTDGNNGGELFVLPCHGVGESGRVGATTDIPFTVLCFTSATGEPVMAAVILKSTKNITDIPISWKMGIDVTSDIYDGSTSYELFETNYGEGKAMPGGPTCRYNGKNLPCFVGCSPNASITSEMLAAMLKEMDKKEIFDRSTGILPTLLLDGHQSRMQTPFLEYANNPDHRWVICLGVPYGTHIWQVADSSQMNGAFKMALTVAKRKLFEFVTTKLNRKGFIPTDIIPLVNAAWERSFGRATEARRAVLQRGWSPLNYVLLDHPKLIKPTVEINNDIDTSTSSVTTGTTEESTKETTTVSFEVNLKGPTTDKMLHRLISEQAKDLGRIKRYEEQLKQMEELKNKLDVLKGLTQITSGQLAAAGIYTLDEDLCDLMKTKDDNDKQKRSEIEIRKQQQQEKERQSFRVSYQKYVRNERLSAADLKVLLRRVRLPADPIIKATRLADLQQMWNERKSRLDDYLGVVEVADAIDDAVVDNNIFIDNTPALTETFSTDNGPARTLVPVVTQNLLQSNLGSATLILSNSENGSKFGEEQPSVGI
jgi:hypothetical protein